MSNTEFNRLLAACFSERKKDHAVEAFCVAIRPFLFVYLVKLSPYDVDLAEDALQNALLKYLSILKDKSSQRGLSLGYFVTVAKHCLIDEIRRRRRFVSLDELVEDKALLEASHAEARILDFGSYEDLLLLAMEKLGARCRFVLERYYIAGIKGPQLATELEISPQSVPMTVKRCREELKEVLLGWTGRQSN